jgi:hypothetical protein
MTHSTSTSPRHRASPDAAGTKSPPSMRRRPIGPKPPKPPLTDPSATSPAMAMSIRKYPHTTRLRQLRWSYGLSIRDVSRGTGINQYHLFRLETGVTLRPTLKTIQRLADFYGETNERISRMVHEGRKH